MFSTNSADNTVSASPPARPNAANTTDTTLAGALVYTPLLLGAEQAVTGNQSEDRQKQSVFSKARILVCILALEKFLTATQNMNLPH
jgi:hypothetical protein